MLGAGVKAMRRRAWAVERDDQRSNIGRLALHVRMPYLQFRTSAIIPPRQWHPIWATYLLYPSLVVPVPKPHHIPHERTYKHKRDDDYAADNAPAALRACHRHLQERFRDVRNRRVGVLASRLALVELSLFA